MIKIMISFLGTIFILFSSSAVFSARMVITGSTTVQPIAEKIAEFYKSENPNVEIEISGGGSGNGIKAIIDGTTDIGNASRFIKEKEVQYAFGKGVYPIPFRIAYDCIIPVVHLKNKVSNLSLEQIRQIFTGDIKNWKELGGGDMPIKVLSRDSSSGTYEVWNKKVMNDMNVFPGAQLESSNGDVVKTVAVNENAIGYIGLGYLTKKVKSIKVDNIEGSSKTTLEGTYPISRPLFMFTNSWPKGDTLKFLNYVLEPGRGQKVVADAGFVALYESGGGFHQMQIQSPDPYYIYETISNIMMVQRSLNKLGYTAGPVDGIKGEKTFSAVKAFQKDNNLPIDWLISNKMMSMLTEQCIKIK
ncbi:MAG: phosphate ABC transporter substrate-binding protein PstS family protein [Deltaproteobacteria bacterium]|nr:phosphate ABC transporter substrate-binding protein PstS family protein [Deltaproteobacteria bacterium]